MRTPFFIRLVSVFLAFLLTGSVLSPASSAQSDDPVVVAEGDGADLPGVEAEIDEPFVLGVASEPELGFAPVPAPEPVPEGDKPGWSQSSPNARGVAGGPVLIDPPKGARSASVSEAFVLGETLADQLSPFGAAALLTGDVEGATLRVDLSLVALGSLETASRTSLKLYEGCRVEDRVLEVEESEDDAGWVLPDPEVVSMLVCDGVSELEVDRQDDGLLVAEVPSPKAAAALLPSRNLVVDRAVAVLDDSDSAFVASIVGAADGSEQSDAGEQLVEDPASTVPSTTEKPATVPPTTEVTKPESTVPPTTDIAPESEGFVSGDDVPVTTVATESSTPAATTEPPVSSVEPVEGGDSSETPPTTNVDKVAPTTVVPATVVPVDADESVDNGSGSAVGEEAAAAAEAVVEESPAGFSVLALSSASGGAQGDFAATTALPMGEHEVGVQTGALNYLYPIDVPAAAAGPQPSVTLSYSSGSVDGLNSATNNQGGPIGVGWSLNTGGRITRLLHQCTDPTAPEDQCIPAIDTFSLSLNGRSSRLVETSTANVYRLQDDPLWRVERKFGAATPDADGEYWVVTIPDGTTHTFGNEAGSVDWVPVWGPGSSNTCPTATIGMCDKAYGWNLDTVTDVFGNRVEYFYGQEKNLYATRNNILDDSFWSEYIRASHLERIEYTSNSNGLTSHARVIFDWEVRCGGASGSGSFGSCLGDMVNPDGTENTAANDQMFDTPNDLWCAHRQVFACEAKPSPNFFTQLRLGAVRTQVRKDVAGAKQWQTLDYYDLIQSFPTGPDFNDGATATGRKTYLYRVGERPGGAYEFSAFEQLDAADATEKSGVNLAVSADVGGGAAKHGEQPGGLVASSVAHGDWIKFPQVYFGESGAGAVDRVRIRYSSRFGGTGQNSRLEVRLDSPTGPKVGEVVIDPSDSTGKWRHFKSEAVSLTQPVSGIRDLYVVAAEDGTPTNNVFVNVSWIRFRNDPGDFAALEHLPWTDFSNGFNWLQNRFSPGTTLPKLIYPRIRYITTPFGGRTLFHFDRPNGCDIQGPTPPNGAWYFSEGHCFASNETIDDNSALVVFNKWVVTESVNYEAIAGGSIGMFSADDLGDESVSVTSYGYTKPQFALSNDPNNPHDAFNDFRGHADVTVKVHKWNGVIDQNQDDNGSGPWWHNPNATPLVHSRQYFFQGKSHDHLNVGQVLVQRSDGAQFEDFNHLRGRPYETVTYDPATGVGLSAAWPEYDAKVTATFAGNSKESARFVYIDTEISNNYIHDGDQPDPGSDGVRRTVSRHSYSNLGSNFWVNTESLYDGEVISTASSSPGDRERRTVTTFAPVNTSPWIMGLACRVELFTRTANPSVQKRTDYVYPTTATGVFSENPPVRPDGCALTPGRATPGITRAHRNSLDNVNSSYETFTELDSRGRLSRSRNGRKIWTTYGYNPVHGKVNRITHAKDRTLERISRNTYDPMHRLESTATPDDPDTAGNEARKTRAAYDVYNRVVSEILPGESTATPTVKYSYDTDLRPVRVRTEQLFENSNYIDSWEYVDGRARSVASVVRGQNQNEFWRTATEYDAAGRVLNTTAADLYISPDSQGGFAGPADFEASQSRTNYDYDRGGAVVTKNLMNGTAIVLSSQTHNDGWRTRLTDPEGNQTVQLHDAWGNLRRVTEYDGPSPYAVTRYAYTYRDELTRVIDDDGNNHRIFYDRLGRKVRLVDPDTGTWRYTYDQNSNLKTQTDGNGKKLRFRYDTLDRPTSTKERIGNSNGDWVELRQYDQRPNGYGQLFQTRSYDTSATTTSSHYVSLKRNEAFDVRGRVTQQQSWVRNNNASPTSRYRWQMGYQYGPADQLQSFVLPEPDRNGGLGPTYIYFYNQNNGLPERLEPEPGGTIVGSTTYNPRGQIVEQTLDGGLVKQMSWDPSTHLAYDVRMGTNPAASNVARLNYGNTGDGGYDLNGNVRRIIDFGNATQRQCFGYDHLDRLTTAFTDDTSTCDGFTPAGVGQYNETYSYDTIGNLTTKPGNGTYNYGTGNTTAAGDAGPHAVLDTTLASNTFSYDNAGNMTTRTVGAVTQTHSYDLQNQLEAVTQGTNVTETRYDADGVRVKRDDGIATTYYPFGGYEYELANTGGAVSTTYWLKFGGQNVAYITNGTTRYTFNDIVSSVGATYDPATQTTNYQRYLPWGETRGTDTINTDTGFTGQKADQSTGLNYYISRYYDPHLGRFTQPDTIIPNPANPQNLNRYTYVSNNPVKYSDPTGHETCYVSGPNAGHCWSEADLAGTPPTSDPINGLHPNASIDHAGWKPWGHFGCAMGTACRTLKVSDGQVTLAEGGDILKNDFANWFFKYFVEDRINNCFGASTTACMIDITSSIGGVGIAGRTPSSTRRTRTQAPTSALDDFGRLCSFSAETGVLMADGTTKPISQVVVGDWVLAEDPETGERGSRQVTHLWVHQDTLVDLEIDGHYVATTEDHPFWNATDNQWQRADALDPGDLVLTADGDLRPVDGYDWTSATSGPAYNLTINDINTYYVSIGDEEVLVHNICLDDAVSTAHGRQRLAEAGFDDLSTDLIRSSNAVYEQADGALAHVAQTGPDAFDFIVVGERGVITAHRGLSRWDLDGLAANFDWAGYP